MKQKEHEIDEQRTFKQLRPYILCIGLIITERGIYWTSQADKAAKDSPLYQNMHEVMNLFFWGIPFTIGGLCIILSLFAYNYRKVNNWYSILTIVGGFTSSIFFGIITFASMYDALNWLSPLTFLTIAVCTGSAALTGVFYYRR